MTEIRVLSLTQPWALYLAAGTKKFETRSWGTSYRGLLAVHAAKGFPGWAREFAETERAIGRCPPRIARGAILGVVRVREVYRTEDLDFGYGLPLPGVEAALERYLGDFSPGRFAWWVEPVLLFDEPLGCGGSLGLWAPPPAVAAEIEHRLAAAGALPP